MNSNIGLFPDTTDVNVLDELHRLSFALTENGFLKFYKSYNHHIIHLEDRILTLNSDKVNEVDELTQSFYIYFLILLCAHSVSIIIFLYELMHKFIVRKMCALKKKFQQSLRRQKLKDLLKFKMSLIQFFRGEEKLRELFNYKIRWFQIRRPRFLGPRNNK